MVDIASIVVAVIALASSVLVAAFTGWLNFFTEERKRLMETRKLKSKYHDPVLLAAQDLQSRLYNITDRVLLAYVRGDNKERQEEIIRYTCFLVGQYLAWVSILHRQAQFLRFTTAEGFKSITAIIGEIQREFSTDLSLQNESAVTHAFRSANDFPRSYTELVEREEKPFYLRRSQQLAIGEIMTVKDSNGEFFCMGYAAFSARWEGRGTDKDQINEVIFLPKRNRYMIDRLKPPHSFREWFESLEHGIYMIGGCAVDTIGVPEQRVIIGNDVRLRRIQHLLMKLIHELDPKTLRIDQKRGGLCIGPNDCVCGLKNCTTSQQYPLHQ